MKERENNYDLLRIFATFAVITIHVAGFWKTARFDTKHFGFLYEDNMLFTWAISGLSRFAVPCFIMMSGAFAIDNEKNSDWRYYYEKMFYKVGIPTLIFSIVFFVYEIMHSGAKVFLHNVSIKELLTPIIEYIMGAPMYHMWYLYMMFGIWLLVPFIIQIKNYIGENKFCKFTIIILFFSVVSLLSSDHTISWDLGFSFCYLGIFILGYLIRRKCIQDNDLKISKNVKVRWWHSWLIVIAGFCMEFPDIYVEWNAAIKGIDYTTLSWEFFSIDTVVKLFGMIGYILIFIGFSKIRIYINLKRIANYTFLVYIIHGGFWNLLHNIVIERFGSKWNSSIAIVLLVCIVFCVSVFLAKMYMVIWDKFNKKFILDKKLFLFFNRWAVKDTNIE